MLKPSLTRSPCFRPALQAAGLAPALSDRSLQATVFAPTDAAFADALAALDVSAQELAAQPALLAAVRGLGWGVQQGYGLGGRGRLHGLVGALQTLTQLSWTQPCIPLITSSNPAPNL